MSEAVQAVRGFTLTLSYPDGEQTVTLTEGIPVVTFTLADIADLVPSETVLVPTEVGADGTRTAVVVIVGMNGVAPPM